MLSDILAAAAIPSQAARFPNPPDLHAVYFDSTETDGPDIGEHRIVHHDCTVELYAPSIEAGDKAKDRLTAQLGARSIRYTTQGWYWLNTIRRYQEIIEFSYIEKT